MTSLYSDNTDSLTAHENTVNQKHAFPFLNWLGGKKQLLHTIKAYYPQASGFDADVYIEPFVGGGAVFFDIIKEHQFEKIVINDFDSNPINSYRLVRDSLDEYIDAIQKEQEIYLNKSYEDKSEHYYNSRKEFNALEAKDDPIRKAVLAIFLNRVAFNALYRMNMKGEMNAAWGKDTRKFQVDFDNLKAVNKVLNENNVIIENKSYAELAEHFTDKTFAFFDPPYRAISKTANFNGYGNGKAKDRWDDNAQLLLRDFIRDNVSGKGAKFLLTNSDPKNTNPDDEFFDEAYCDYFINRVSAKRSISGTTSGRKAINELFISNVDTTKENDVSDT